MKKILLLVCLLVICMQAYPSKGEKTKSFELKVSLTRPLLVFDREPRLGFGLVAQKIYFPEKRVNMVSGLTLKNVNYYESWSSCGFGCDWYDLTFHAFILTVPTLARFSFGKTVKFYIESGPEVNIVPTILVSARQVTYWPMDEGEKDISKRSPIISNGVTLGFNLGAGFRIPIAGKEYVLGCSYHDLISHRSNGGNEHLRNLTVQLGIVLNK